MAIPSTCFVTVARRYLLGLQTLSLYSVSYLGNVAGGIKVRYINLPIDELKASCMKALIRSAEALMPPDEFSLVMA